MKERIYTIPVNDAFAKDCECALCELEVVTTRDLVNYYMGASMMESDVRVSTNEKGFCSRHLAAMYNLQENRLALGLMLHTHLDDVCKDIGHKLEKSAAPSVAGKIFAGKGDVRQGLVKLAERIEKRTESCALCERLEYTMDRYIDVILWQFLKRASLNGNFLKAKVSAFRIRLSCSEAVRNICQHRRLRLLPNRLPVSRKHPSKRCVRT